MGSALVVLVLIAMAYAVVAAAMRWTAPLTPSTHIDLSPLALPAYAGLSTLRMALAYVLSLVFSLVYARIAVASRAAERIMIPRSSPARPGTWPSASTTRS